MAALMFLYCILCFPSVAQAKEISKDVEITLPDDYVQCSFFATFEKETIEDTILIDPRGQEYRFTENIGGEGLKCTIKKARSGVYHVISTVNIEDNPDKEGTDPEENLSDDPSSETNDDALQPPENSSGSDADEVIGKITITVKAEDESSDVVSNNIKIAKEIDGLKIYWKDDDLVVEWTDESVGKVNVIVINSKNLQIIASEKVAGNYFSCGVDQSIEEVIISIVPAESSSVNGAGNEYVKKVDNYPDATVHIEPFEYTNLDAIPATVNLNKPYSLLYTVNDEEVGKTDVLSSGEHDIEVPTVIGSNDLKIYVVDEDGNMRSTGISFIKDIEPPILKITNDISGIQTYDSSITFTGTVEDFDTLTFRNESVFVDWDGAFSIEASLKDGENELVLTAKDLAGNESTYTAVVTKLVVQEKPIPWNIIITASGIVLILLLFLLKKKFGIHMPKKKSIHYKRPAKTRRQGAKSDYIFASTVILCYIVLIYFVFMISTVGSGSMAPNINTGEVILVDRLSYTVKDPQRGDIVTFHSNEGNKDQLKRIIGLPGETISFKDGYIFIDGVICDESRYLAQDIETNSQDVFVVPDGCYFLLGDNRGDSVDSRYWSDPYISKKQIIGKLLLHINFRS